MEKDYFFRNGQPQARASRAGGAGLVQPVRFVQGDAHPLGPLLRRAVRLLLQEIQVADHRGQGRADVVGQIHDQLVLPPFRQGGLFFPFRQRPLDGVELALEGQHFRREVNLFPVVCQQGFDAPVDFAEIAAHSPKDLPQHHGKDQKHRPAEEEVLVEAEMVAVKVKSLLAAQVQDVYQKPDDDIPHAPFPEQPVQRRDGQDRQRHAAADPPGKLGVKDRIAVQWTPLYSARYRLFPMDLIIAASPSTRRLCSWSFRLWIYAFTVIVQYPLHRFSSSVPGVPAKTQKICWPHARDQRNNEIQFL